MYDTLVDTKVLKEHNKSENWCVVDCRASLTDPDFGRAAYTAGHIPGAVYADLATDLSGPVIAGVTGRHPLPQPDSLATTLGRFGIGDSTQVVAYDAGNGAFAARLWWLLRWLGHAAVAVLDGGLAAWQAAGLELNSGTERRAAADFPIRPPLTRAVNASDLLADRQHRLLLDARAAPRFRGEIEPIDAVAGHIPGARCLPFEGNLDAAGRFLSAQALRDRFAAVAETDRELVCYCGSGVTACHNILAMRHAGLAEAALYPGSYSEWIVDPKRPVER